MNGGVNQSLLFSDHSNRQTAIRSDQIPNSDDVFVIFCSRRPSTARFIFNRFFTVWMCFNPPKNLSPWNNIISILYSLKLMKSVRRTVTKSEAKPDSRPSLETVVTHFQNVIKKTRFTKWITTDQRDLDFKSVPAEGTLDVFTNHFSLKIISVSR